MIPPGAHGGNMDSPFNRRGTRLLLPVHHPGALLSFGDPHARQGEGEVCGTGIETPARARVSVRLLRRGAYPTPSLVVGPESARLPRRYATVGIHRNLERASREALERMLEVMAHRGWTAKEAYLLCSLVGDLRIAEVVDEPKRLVSMVMPMRWLSPPR